MKSPFWAEEQAAWRPPEDMTVSECADRHRVLSTKAQKSGPWETSYIPFAREIMDSFGVDCVEEIWFKKPTQIGGTDGILNMILYAALQDPGPAMIVEPNENMAGEISQERVDEMIRTCDALREVQSRNDDDTTKKKKSFQSMTLYFGWAGSPASLASRPIRYVFFDEVNKYPPFSGKEANPLKLGRERTETFIFTRKLVYISTPALEDGYISKGEEECDCRFRYFIACPHCAHRQQLVFSQVKWPEDKRDPSEVEEIAWYECEACSGAIRNDLKPELIRRGKWVDLKSGLEFGEAIDKLKPRRVGFHISRLYHPLLSFGYVAAEFLRSKDDPAALMNWKNSWMAEEWIDRVVKKETAEILSHRTDLGPLICHPDTIALTAGIDPGQGGFWFSVLAWRPQNRIHLVHYGFLMDWENVRGLVFENVYDSPDGKYPIWRAGLDTGGSESEGATETMTEAAYQFLRTTQSNRLFGTKGRSTRGLKRLDLSVIDKMPGKGNVPIPGGLSIWLIDSDAFKDAFHYRLQVKPGDPGEITLHDETAEDFAKHILAEEKRRNRKGELEWVQVSKANHLLDTTIIALAMGDPECWGGVRVLPRAQRLEPPKGPPEKGDEGAPKSPWLGQNKGWLRR